VTFARQETIAMKLNLRKVMAETHIKRIQKELEDLDALEAQAKLKPIEQTDDTFLAVTQQEQRNKLLKELEKYRKIVNDK
jgi:hypothetical protein